MPNEASVVLITISALLVVIALAALIPVLRDLWLERQHPNQGWDETQELVAWRQDRDRERLTCTYCKGTRCEDWRRNERVCGENPTKAAMTPVLVGTHARFSHEPGPAIAGQFRAVQRTVAGWWPLPRTLSGRLNPDLWRKVADHCQVALTRPRAMVLP